MFQRQGQGFVERIDRRRRFAGRGDDDDDLALGFGQVRVIDQDAEAIAVAGFIELGQLAADAGLAVAKRGQHVGERLVQARAGLEEDQGCRLVGELGEEGLARRRFVGRKTGEGEAVGRQAGQAQGGQHRRGARDRMDVDAGLAGDFDQAEARVGDQRRAGVGNLGDDLADAQPLDDLGQDLGTGMVIVTQQGFLDVVGRQKLGGDAGVLGQDDIGRLQHVQRAQRDVAQIADGRRHDIEAGRDGSGRGREKRGAHGIRLAVS